VINHC